MRKKNKPKRNWHVVSRKLSVGIIKGKIRKMARKIALGEITDEETIFNSNMEISKDSYGRGYDQKLMETRWFKERRKETIDNAWKQELDNLDDLINEKK